MSHARNLVEYGFIGVNPSGGRVEGYSAPVQFFLYAAAYAVTGVGYATYAKAQTMIATFLLGVLWVLFFPERKVLAVALAGLAAVCLVWLRPFLLWHGSGMENAVTHVLFLATVLGMVMLVRNPERGGAYWWAIPIFLASISRIEGIWHIGPMLVIFGVFWRVAFRNWRGARVSLLVLGLWALFQGWRYLYFGDVLPNTAYAQGISVFDNLRPWLALDWEHMRAGSILDSHGGVLLLSLPALLVVSPRREYTLLALLLGSLALTAAFNESVFGRARLDIARTTTHLAVVSALGAVALLYCLLRSRRARWVAPVLVMTGLLALAMKSVEPYRLCCETSWIDDTRQYFARISNTEDLPRATVANLDLGVVSWHKQFNVVDMGFLGSPLIAKLQPPLRSDYFFHYAAPDIIRMHSSMSCYWDAEIFSDPRFGRLYQPLETWITDWTRENCHANPQSRSGFWIRRDILKSSRSAERRLIDQMKTDLSATRLQDELGHCQDSAAGRHDCTYVARTAYRFLPEFRSREQINRLEEIFAASRTAPFDLYLVTGYRDGQAHQAFIRFMIELQAARIELSEPIIRSVFDVYLLGKRLVYFKQPCRRDDNDARFFLHVYPVDERDLSDERRQYGFENLDFWMKGHTRAGGQCTAMRGLPDYPVAEIRTGQFTGEGPLWEGRIEIGTPVAVDRSPAL